MAWSKNGTTTLSSAGDSQVLSITNTEFSLILNHELASGQLAGRINYDNDSGSKYAQRQSFNGAADTTLTSQTVVYWSANDSVSDDQFIVCYLCNIVGEEVLGMFFGVSHGGAGAANDPDRRENVHKFTDTTALTSIDVSNAGTGDFDTGSNLTALNGDTTESLVLGNIQSGSRMEVTDTRKIYYWNGSTFTEEA